MAILYLRERADQGSVKACDALGNASFKELFKVIPSPLSLNSPSSASKSLKAMKDAWGFVPMDIKLCDSLFMLPAEVKNDHLSSANMLNTWLKTLPYPVYQNTPIDLNGDGLEDRLVFLETSENGDLDVWAFFMTADGYIAKYFDYSSSKDDLSEITIFPLEINDGTKAFMLPSEDSISIDILKTNLQNDSNAYFYQPDVQSYKVIRQTQPVQVMLDVKDQDERKTLVLSWNEFSQSLIGQNAIDLTVSQIEKLLYVDQNYPSVIDRVDTLLSNVNSEAGATYLCGISVSKDFRVDFPEAYAAYFLYMRALALEQMGQVNQARDAYYALWRDYPDNLFGIAASKKLIQANP
jgi:hypothetical protein